MKTSSCTLLKATYGKTCQNLSPTTCSVHSCLSLSLSHTHTLSLSLLKSPCVWYSLFYPPLRCNMSTIAPLRYCCLIQQKRKAYKTDLIAQTYIVTRKVAKIDVRRLIYMLFVPVAKLSLLDRLTPALG